MSEASAPQISILGCGWLGVGLAQVLLSRDVKVHGSTTSAAGLKRLRSIGIEPLLLRIDAPENSSGSSADDTSQYQAIDDVPMDQRIHRINAKTETFFSSPKIFLMIPPGGMTEPNQYAQILNSYLRLWTDANRDKGTLAKESSSKHCEFIMVSSISVFGSNQGHVDDMTQALPDSTSGSEILAAEKLLTETAKAIGCSLTIVRAGGLVGIGRNPGLFLTGRKNVKNPDWPVNLIHQADLATALANWALRIPDDRSKSVTETQIFNAVANSHPSRREFYDFASRKLDLTPPSFSEQILPVESGKCVDGTRFFAKTETKIDFSDWMSALKEKRL
jgi:hypothetical protein